MPIPTKEGQEVWDNLAPGDIQAAQDFLKRCQSRKTLGIEDFTCADCKLVTTCIHSFDLYNLDGDCLAEK